MSGAVSVVYAIHGLEFVEDSDAEKDLKWMRASLVANGVNIVDMRMDEAWPIMRVLVLTGKAPSKAVFFGEKEETVEPEEKRSPILTERRSGGKVYLKAKTAEQFKQLAQW